MNRKRIDLNCDVGESFGVFRIGADSNVFPHITSANIACGWHSGDAATMRQTVALAIRYNVAIGAHPGLPDLAGFGRRNMALTADEVYEAVLYQLGALQAFVRARSAKLHHVKPHGAMYNTAAKNKEWAAAIARAVRDFDPALVLVGLAGSELIAAGKACGLRTAGEAFADRSYQSDGSLTDRSHDDALVQDVERAADQALRIVTLGKVRSLQGVDVPIDADTICIHGDRPDAAAIASAISQRLKENQIALQRV